MSSETDLPLCPDWVFLNNANVNIAKDRGWFKSYTPFTSKVNGAPFIDGPNDLPVLGIGTVEIPTKRSPNTSAVSSHGTLILKEVLHVPDIICNVLGQPLIHMDGYNALFDCSTQKSKGYIKDKQGRKVAFFAPQSPLFALRLRSVPDGPKYGPYALKKGVMYMLGVRWDAEERLKWQEFQAGNVRSTSQQMFASYTAEEKAFLKAQYGSEYKFLLQQGLKIHNEEDRKEGRAILRLIMYENEMSELEVSGNDEDEFGESDFEGHQADYNFTHRQLDWIEDNYGNSEQFMLSYGLKFYNEDDVEEAKAIAKAMMREDD